MGILSAVKSIYALDTLDTRFTNSSSTPYKAVLDGRRDPATSTSKRHDSISEGTVQTDRNGGALAKPSRWNTLEFYIYYVVFLTIVPYMFWIVYDVSRPSHPSYHKFEPYLSPGWIPGRKIDITDAQYFTFRRNIPYMSLLLAFHPLARKLYNILRPLPSRNNPSVSNRGLSNISTSEGQARLIQRSSFDFGFALVFLAALHGYSVFKVLVILYANFCIATRLPRTYIPAATWIFNISTLFANELSEGYPYAKIAALLWPFGADSGNTLINWGAWFDSQSGIMPRWQIPFNLTVLRLISFNMDYYWSLHQRGVSALEKQLDPANLSEKDRIKIPASPEDYCFRNYLGYALYGPLYIAGPIITFNDYISQLKYAPKTIETSRTIKYGIRFLLTLLAMEIILHFDYCIVISKVHPNWSDYTAAQISLLSFFNLHILWLKLLLPWRLFRLWSLIDGMDPPENMFRCVSNNPSTIQFWRAWHRSYNRWLVRYIYLPMGGLNSRTWVSSIRSVVNYAAVFTFVALWHDISLNLLVWGWLVVFFMLPEVIAKYLFPKKKWENNPTAYRVLCGIGGVGNLFMMMVANLVGFAVGVDGLKSIFRGILQDYSGLIFLVTASSSVFVAVQVMFEVRESEVRKGISVRC